MMPSLKSLAENEVEICDLDFSHVQERRAKICRDMPPDFRADANAYCRSRLIDLGVRFGENVFKSSLRWLVVVAGKRESRALFIP